MAHHMAPLEAQDLRALGPRQVATVLPDSAPFVGETPDLPPQLQEPGELADHALKRWGRPREEIESEFNGGGPRRPDPVPWA